MKNHFLYFTKAERFGIIGLLALCLILWIIPACWPEQVVVDASDTSSEPGPAATRQDTASAETVDPSIAFHAFDPNQVSEDELVRMGLPERTARSWQNYLRKGGRFRNWQDVQRFRALSEEDRKQIKPFVHFSTDEKARAPGKSTEEQTEVADFDPNQQSRASLMQMGLSAKVASSWANYLKAGGQFRRVEDIRKVYGLSEADYERLAPFAQFPDLVEEWAAKEVVPETSLPSSYQKAEASLVIDINQASATEWQRLHGIGPAYSRRIVNFRDKLGGFHSIDQIRQTYGLPDSVFQSIALQLRPSPVFRKLMINRATVEELAAHPYLRFADARLIVNYRAEHGNFSTSADLEALYGLTTALRQQMEPYWSFE